MIYPGIKRFFDLLVSIGFLILLLPLMLPVIFLLRITGEGRIFYLQERIGKDQKPFRMIKFATMLENSLNMGARTVTLPHDPRITTLGKFLRKTKINELPQLINVLKGDMSFVGPRPLLPASFKKYFPEVRDRISRIRPGITGIGSVIFRDEAVLVAKVAALGMEPLDYYRDHIYPYKGQLEMWYQQRMSFYLDFVLILLTAVSIIYPGNSLSYKIFSDLPPKPAELTLEGIRKLTQVIH
jgi:lipopolysaccharide/colanic/teichoic acid biosynthesis glycosyltransferase